MVGTLRYRFSFFVLGGQKKIEAGGGKAVNAEDMRALSNSGESARQVETCKGEYVMELMMMDLVIKEEEKKKREQKKEKRKRQKDKASKKLKRTVSRLGQSAVRKA